MKKVIAYLFPFMLLSAGCTMDCDTCTISSLTSVKMQNLGEEEIDWIRSELFEQRLIDEIKEKYPMYADNFMRERVQFRVKKTTDAISGESSTKISVGFKYIGSERKATPEIEQHAKEITELFSQQLLALATEIYCETSVEPECSGPV